MRAQGGETAKLYPAADGADAGGDWPGVREWLRRNGRDAPASVAGRGPVRAFLSRPGGVLGVVLMLLMVVTALSAPLLFPGDPLRTVGPPLLWPGQDMAFPLGTDSLGRDLLAMLAHGARLSLGVGALATVISVVIGTLVGSMAGYFGGLVGAALTRLTEIFQTTPIFLFLVVLVTLVKPSGAMVALAIGLTAWESLARVVRAEFRQLLQSDYVTASRSAGFSAARIILREILPNVAPSIIVLVSFKMAMAIFIESGLAFLGLGDPDAASWGAMINEGKDFLRTSWHLTMLPTLAIVVTVLALNLIGDALNDALNPRLRGEA